MTSKEFVLKEYPNAWAFRWIYDNRIKKPTYVIMKGSGLEPVCYNTSGNDTESKAWVHAKNTLQTIKQ